MIPNIVIAKNELTSPKFGEAFAHGCKGNVVSEYKRGDWAGFGSPKTWDGLLQCIKAGNNFYYGDHAYFGRGVYYRITKNAFQYHGNRKPDYERLRAFYEKPKPWRKNGEHIIICTQSESHHQRFCESDWLEKTIKKIQKFSDRKIILRTKKSKPLIYDLENAWCLVTHTSNASIEAIMQGIPAIVTGDGAASRFCFSDAVNVENPLMNDFDRMAMAGTLANSQWTLEEIKSGMAWKALIDEEI